MIASYDNTSRAVYIRLERNRKIHQTIEFAPETLVDIDAQGNLIGVELLRPASFRLLKRIGEKYQHDEIVRVNVRMLRHVLDWKHVHGWK
jgi:uncharacterized protein YuzE